MGDFLKTFTPKDLNTQQNSSSSFLVIRYIFLCIILSSSLSWGCWEHCGLFLLLDNLKLYFFLTFFFILLSLAVLWRLCGALVVTFFFFLRLCGEFWIQEVAVIFQTRIFCVCVCFEDVVKIIFFFHKKKLSSQFFFSWTEWYIYKDHEEVKRHHQNFILYLLLLHRNNNCGFENFLVSWELVEFTD